MGSFNSSQSSGKGSVTYPGQGGQPAFGDPSQSMTMPQSMGQQNQYGNTVGGWDNASIQPQSTGASGGKGGKGQSSWQPFNASWAPSATQTNATQASGTQNQINAQGNQRFGT